VPVLQRSALVVLHGDCKRQVAQQQQSRGILLLVESLFAIDAQHVKLDALLTLALRLQPVHKTKFKSCHSHLQWLVVKVT
jgi:hypothetical protein